MLPWRIRFEYFDDYVNGNRMLVTAPRVEEPPQTLAFCRRAFIITFESED